MRNTLQEQYNLLKEGKMNKQHFFKSARHIFPDLITPVNSFSDAVTILKNRGVISENIGGLVTTGKKQDWMSIFNENMTALKEENLGHNEEWSLQPEGRFWIITYRTIDGKKEKVFQSEEEAREWIKNNLSKNANSLNESKEVKEPSKEVTDIQKHAYDNKDEKNYDNIFGQEFLKGYYTEMKDPKNTDKDVEELRAIVAKNLAKDINYYVKDGQFGVKGLGYTTEAPGLGEPKEAKGKYKSSGYGDLKESVLRLAIQDIIREVLAEADDKMPPLRRGDKGMFDGEEVEILAVPMHAKKDPKEPQPFSYTIKTKAGKKYEDVPISSVKPLNEALDKDAIKTEGEDAKKNAMKKRITNEIVTRKKKIKALETLTELEEGNEENDKKLKELQSEIKQLEGMMGKLDKKKVKEAGAYGGRKAKDDLRRDSDYNTLSTQGKMNADKQLDAGGIVTVGEDKKK